MFSDACDNSTRRRRTENTRTCIFNASQKVRLPLQSEDRDMPRHQQTAEAKMKRQQYLRAIERRLTGVAITYALRLNFKHSAQ